MPLKVLFFSGEVYETWRKKCLSLGADVRDGLQVLHDPLRNSSLLAGQDAMLTIDASYSSLLPHLEKSQRTLANVIECKCSICDGTIGNQGMALTCSTENCRMISHMTCLSRSFLDYSEGDSSILPMFGDCPCCKARLQWVDLVKELSLRIRGPLTIEKLKRRVKRQKLKVLGSEASTALDTASETSEQEDATDLDAPDSGSLSMDQEDHLSSDRDVMDPFGEDAWNGWQHIVGEDDAISNAGDANDSALSPLRLSNPTQPKLKLPIEDSEGDSGEALE